MSDAALPVSRAGRAALFFDYAAAGLRLRRAR